MGVAEVKGLRSLIILVLWEIWNERNIRIFQNKEQTIHRKVNKIKDQTATWIAAGAKHLEFIINTPPSVANAVPVYPALCACTSVDRMEKLGLRNMWPLPARLIFPNCFRGIGLSARPLSRRWLFPSRRVGDSSPQFAVRRSSSLIPLSMTLLVL
uniref:Uncharacterized protein n=1 Tax=Setaria viridis TaxID=4556 RepID=A0A4V6D9I6_SETVI|nr:hypothetical protein SEVIR_3G165300v2 [Setaria viridis]